MKHTIFKSNSIYTYKSLFDKNYHLCHNDKYISRYKTIRLTK